MPVKVADLERRLEDLKQLRSSWDIRCRQVRDYIYPDAGDFEGDRVAEGDDRFLKLMNTCATNALSILAAGMMGGISSPSIPWFRLSTSSPDLDETPNVKRWLSDCQRKMLMVFSHSEIYNTLHRQYAELAAFGTAASIIEPSQDPDRIIDYIPLTFGEYWIAEDDSRRVNTLYRRIRMNAVDMIRRWGDKCTKAVREDFEHGKFYAQHTVYHAIEPRFDRDPRKVDAMNMPWRSVYFQRGADHVLSESGYATFPATCPRWSTSGASVYGRGVGMTALSTVKRLQQKEFRMAQAVDFQANPPVQVPKQFEGRIESIRPGSLIFVDVSQQGQGVRSAYEVTAKLDGLAQLIAKDERTIHEDFFVNLFQMVASTAERERTAYEVAQLEQEKMMVLGPVLERLSLELFDPLIKTSFNILREAGELPDIPEELIPDLTEREEIAAGERSAPGLSIEYVGTLMQAQKATSLAAIDRLYAHVGAVAQAKPEILDRIDVDADIEEYADRLGVPPQLLVPKDDAENARRDRAEAQAQAAQQQMQLEQMKAMSHVPHQQAGDEPTAGTADSLMQL